MPTILAAIDFSPVTEAVVTCAVELCRSLRSELVLFTAVPVPMIVADFAPIISAAKEYEDEMARRARKQLSQWRRRLAAEKFSVRVICEHGFPAPLIAKIANELDVSHVVIGSHGHSAVYDLVLGSTTALVVKQAQWPVVVVPSNLPARRLPPAPSKRKIRTPATRP